VQPDRGIRPGDRQQAVRRLGGLPVHPLLPGQERDAPQVVDAGQALRLEAGRGEGGPVVRAAGCGPAGEVPELGDLQPLQVCPGQRLGLRVPVRGVTIRHGRITSS
jgi:hypothetical protein